MSDTKSAIIGALATVVAALIGLVGVILTLQYSNKDKPVIKEPVEQEKVADVKSTDTVYVKQEVDLKVESLKDEVEKLKSELNKRKVVEPPVSDNSIKYVSDDDGNSYPTKVMKDGKRWMTQNLNIKVKGSWCYETPKICEKFGRLYTWEAAKEACKQLGDGWHLPTDEEWNKMVDQYGGAGWLGKAKDDGIASYQELIEKGSSGFDALLGGHRSTGGSFQDLGAGGSYWSATETDGGNAYFYNFLGVVERLGRGNFDQGWGFSVRCLQN